MGKLKSLQDLTQLREQARSALKQRQQSTTTILIGAGTCGVAAGAKETLAAIQAELAARGLNAHIATVGCIGMCVMEPLIEIKQPGRGDVLYANVMPEMVGRLVQEHIVEGRPVREWAICRLPVEGGESPEFGDIPLMKDLPFFSKQVRIALQNCGVIDPERIDEYIARNGYAALGQVIADMSPEDVIRTVREAGLRGRGGAGFPSAIKWDLCRKASGSPKYVVCNADEGDPGAFMDRSILESDPHALLEGMAIAAYAIGATQGYIYVRAEYPLAIQRLQAAIGQARELGLLGDNILSSPFSLDIHLKEGAGAFVCGEETALIASIEGRRGEPRPRPPFPVASGLWGKPTNINNVKSYAITPQIVLRGSKWFSSIGSPKSPGTAIFALTGKINNTGLIEVPMGIPLGDIVFDVGGGIPKGKSFKAVQTGGPLGGCIPASSLNTPVDFDSLQEAGAVMGSGGMIVVDDDTCMVEFARYFLEFAAAESCGKCVPCRVGGQRLLEALKRITEGAGTTKDLDIIREVSAQMMSSSLCGLGQGTPRPVMSALRFFEQEFKDHVHDKICRAGQCKPLVRAKCVNTCPAGVDTPAYLALISQGRYAEGLAIHRERNPFPMICGRACPAFCETTCRRGEIDDSVAIRMVKRFMADTQMGQPWTPQPIGPVEQRQTNAKKKIAVVGGGPAGLTAALRLAQMGYKVTVFEKYPVAGGMLTWAIPEYRLPRQPLLLEIENIRRAGVDIQCNKELGRDFTLADLMEKQGFAAVVLAIGAHRSRMLGIPGEDKRGVLNGIDFLRDVAGDANAKALNLREKYAVPDLRGKRVGVVGGGDVAIDASRVALRLGAKEVHVVYRRTSDAMPAAHLPEEIEGAIHEGVQIHTLVNPVEVVGDGAVSGVRIQRQRLTDFDDSARRRPAAIGGDDYVLGLDYLIPAIGQTPDQSWMRAGGNVDVTRGQTFVVNDALCTSRPGIFAAGDAVSGAATIVEAIAQGNLVAVAVDTWVRTGQMVRPRYVTPRRDLPQTARFEDYASARRAASPKLPVAQRGCNFREVELGFAEQAAREEARRCLRCDLEWLDVMKLPRPAEANT